MFDFFPPKCQKITLSCFCTRHKLLILSLVSVSVVKELVSFPHISTTVWKVQSGSTDLISSCLSLRVTKVACPSVCLSTATCCVSSTVTWLHTWNTPQREWTSSSTSWTRRPLTVRRLQQLLTTGEQIHRPQTPVYPNTQNLYSQTFMFLILSVSHFFIHQLISLAVHRLSLLSLSLWAQAGLLVWRS